MRMQCRGAISRHVPRARGGSLDIYAPTPFPDSCPLPPSYPIHLHASVYFADKYRQVITPLTSSTYDPGSAPTYRTYRRTCTSVFRVQSFIMLYSCTHWDPSVPPPPPPSPPPAWSSSRSDEERLMQRRERVVVVVVVSVAPAQIVRLAFPANPLLSRRILSVRIPSRSLQLSRFDEERRTVTRFRIVKPETRAPGNWQVALTGWLGKRDYFCNW